MSESFNNNVSLRTVAALLLAALFVATACGRKQGAEEEAAARNARLASARVVARVKVTREGAVRLDGREVSPEELKQALAALKAEEGAVWYYREDARSSQSEKELAAMRVIVSSDLPVKPCETEEEFNAPR